jgi:hypothetical protein
MGATLLAGAGLDWPNAAVTGALAPSTNAIAMPWSRARPVIAPSSCAEGYVFAKAT